MKYYINYADDTNIIKADKINSYRGGANIIDNIDYGSEYKLIKDGTIDHNFFEKKIKFNGLEFKLLSLNIAQLDQLKTMAKHNKIINYIRKEENLIKTSKFPIDNFLNDIAKITTKYKDIIKNEISSDDNFDEIKLELQSKYISNNDIIKEVKDLIKKKYIKYLSEDLDINLKIAWLRKKDKFYSEILIEEIDKELANETDPNKIINLENIKKAKRRFPNDYYIDVYFSKETSESYYSRIDKAINFLSTRIKDDKNIIICLQEINPVFNDENLNICSELDVIFKKYHLNFIYPEDYKEYVYSTCSILLTRGNLEVTPYSDDLVLEEDQIINTHELIRKINIGKGILQNFRYKLSFKGQHLDIFNVHTNLFSYDSAYDKLNQIVEYSRDKQFILVGDMNLLIDEKRIHRINMLFRDNRIALDLLQTPEVDYNDTYYPTYDIFIGKGIDIVY